MACRCFVEERHDWLKYRAETKGRRKVLRCLGFGSGFICSLFAHGRGGSLRREGAADSIGA